MALTICRDSALVITGGVIFDGGAGNDTLHGPATDSTWHVTGAGEGDIDGDRVGFTGVENLGGGAGADVFTLAEGASHIRSQG